MRHADGEGEAVRIWLGKLKKGVRSKSRKRTYFTSVSVRTRL